MLLIGKRQIRASNRPAVRSPSKSRSARTESKGADKRIVSLACEIQDSLDATLSLGRAVGLMLFGMRDLSGDYNGAFLTVGEIVPLHLERAKNACRQIMAESGTPARKASRR